MGKACVRLIIRSHEELDASAHGNRTESTNKPQQRPPAALHQPEGLKPARGQILSTAQCNFSCPSRASSTVHSPRPRPPGLWPAQPAQPSMAFWCSLGGGFCKGGQKGTSPQARRAGRPQTNTSPLPMQAHAVAGAIQMSMADGGESCSNAVHACAQANVSTFAVFKILIDYPERR